MTMSGNLSELLTHAAQADGERPAIFDLDREWTFEQADRDAGRLASALADAGVGRGDHIGVHLHKCAEGFLAMHGVVRLGAIAVPLDPGSPTDRLADVCTEMGITTVVTHDPRAETLTKLVGATRLDTVIGLTIPVVGARTISPADVAEFDALDPVDVSPDDPAYVITTSGSTGEPKGIVHTHRSALAYALLSGAAFDVNADDRISDIAPHHFDISTFATWTAPAHRAAIVVVPEPHQRMPASHAQLLEQHKVTIWYSVPFLLQQLVLRGDLSNRDLSSLRWVQVGGEVILSQVLAAFMELVPSTKLANIYGPAEVNQCSMFVLSSPPPPDTAIPIGRPWEGAEFRVVDPNSADPSSEPLEDGELWVAATTMMRSYHGKSPVESNIVEADGRRWYRTGDLVSRDDQGDLVFVSRVDDQVKVRGHRVELAGIEQVLESLGGVESAVATVWRDASDGDRVVAAVISPSESFVPEVFLAAARDRLPVYAAPSQVVVLNGAQTTKSGKLDRRALREEALDQLIQGQRS